MESSVVQEGITNKGVTADLDRLGEKIELAIGLIGELREERRQLRDERTALRREVERLQAERREVAQRLGGLIEKVDLLERDS